MRQLTLVSDNLNFVTPVSSAVTGGERYQGALPFIPRNLPLPQSLRSSIGDLLPGRQTNNAVGRMIQSLRTATESHLEGSRISVADLAIPVQATGNTRNQLKSTCQALGLSNNLPSQPSAGVLAAMANDVGGTCPNTPGAHMDPAQLVLTLDYSRAALTMSVWAEECAVYEERRTLNEPNLGASALATCQQNRGEQECQSLLADQIRDFVQKPSDKGDPRDIGSLVLLGESTKDQRLEAALKQVLGDQYTRWLATSAARSKPVDPAFAASDEVADASWEAGQQSGCPI